jgi:hypothetical protein
MGIIKFHEIWIEQCKAAKDLKIKFGLNAAFDDIVTEKLLDYMNAAARHPQFAQELPRFVSTVRQMFTFEEHGHKSSEWSGNVKPRPSSRMIVQASPMGTTTSFLKVRLRLPSAPGSSTSSKSCRPPRSSGLPERHGPFRSFASGGWGSMVDDRLSADLRSKFPQTQGFSSANLRYMSARAEA